MSCGLNHAGLVVSGDLYTWGSTHSGKWENILTKQTYIISYLCRLGHGDIEQQPVAAPLKVETLSMLKWVMWLSCAMCMAIMWCIHLY